MIVNQQVRLKDIYLTKFGHLFALEKYPLLQDPVRAMGLTLDLLKQPVWSSMPIMPGLRPPALLLPA